MAMSIYEQKFHEQLKETTLATSIQLIREAMVAIWAPTTRIIRDYTDHGEEHSKRIIEYAAKLIKSSTQMSLEKKEVYLLLAGAYLHDIGMQCDVALHSAVKKMSEEKYSAKFETNFNSRRSTDFSIEEQKELRANHQSVTAAWLDCVYSSEQGSGKLEAAVRSVPDDLIDDLIDICRYHSKANIRTCETYSKYDQSCRKRLIAAILRMSDELDINSNRVEFETIKMYRLDTNNSLYWWLHNKTVVTINGNIITLHVRLHPNDIELEDIVKKAFIDEFVGKNRSVVSVLQEERLSIAISAGSGVVKDERTKKLPSDVVDLLKSKLSEYDELEAQRKIVQSKVTLADLSISSPLKAQEGKDGSSGRKENNVSSQNIKLNNISTFLHNFSHSYKNTMSEIIKTSHNMVRSNPTDLSQFLGAAIDNIKAIVDEITGDECALSINVMADDESVFTLGRDAISRRQRREIDLRVPLQKWIENTHYSTILDADNRSSYFLSNDLQKEAYYRNSVPGWDRYYNAIVVVPIKRDLGGEGEMMIATGFLCVDNFHGGFDQVIVEMLAMFADYLFVLFHKITARNIHDNSTQK